MRDEYLTLALALTFKPAFACAFASLLRCVPLGYHADWVDQEPGGREDVTRSKRKAKASLKVRARARAQDWDLA